jgi:hypothetical protein
MAFADVKMGKAEFMQKGDTCMESLGKVALSSGKQARIYDCRSLLKSTQTESYALWPPPIPLTPEETKTASGILM